MLRNHAFLNIKTMYTYKICLEEII